MGAPPDASHTPDCYVSVGHLQYICLFSSTTTGDCIGSAHDTPHTFTTHTERNTPPSPSPMNAHPQFSMHLWPYKPNLFKQQPSCTNTPSIAAPLLHHGLMCKRAAARPQHVFVLCARLQVHAYVHTTKALDSSMYSTAGRRPMKPGLS